MVLRFVPAETNLAYMETLRGYLNDHGVPSRFASGTERTCNGAEALL